MDVSLCIKLSPITRKINKAKLLYQRYFNKYIDAFNAINFKMKKIIIINSSIFKFNKIQNIYYWKMILFTSYVI